jgi:hypothetical protein
LPDNPARNECALAPQTVNQRTGGSLGDDSGDSANGQGYPHILLVPFVSRQIDGNKWPNPRLNIREEKIQPIQTTKRLDRRISKVRFLLHAGFHQTILALKFTLR